MAYFLEYYCSIQGQSNSVQNLIGCVSVYSMFKHPNKCPLATEEEQIMWEWKNLAGSFVMNYSHWRQEDSK